MRSGFDLNLKSQSLLNQVNVSNNIGSMIDWMVEESRNPFLIRSMFPTVPPQSILDRCKIFDKNEHLRGVSPLRASEMGVYLKYLIISTS